MAFLQFAPFLLIVVLANVAAKRPRAEPVVYAALVLINSITAGAGALLLLAVYALPLLGGQSPMPPGVNWRDLGLVLLGMGFLATLVLLPSVRRGLARVMSINSESVVHATALASAVYYVGSTAATILLAGGLQGLASASSPPSSRDILASGASLALVGLFGAGFLIRRSPRKTFRRLGLTIPRLSHLGAAVAIVIAFLVFDYLVAFGWSRLWPESYAAESDIIRALFGAVPSIGLSAAVGLSAGISEETLMRGAVQPRFGLVITSALFALGHLQYGFSPALLEVFIVGIVLGLVRRRANTTTCILIHTLYNFADLLLAPLFP